MRNFKSFLREAEIDTSHFMTDPDEILEYIKGLNRFNNNSSWQQNHDGFKNSAKTEGLVGISSVQNPFLKNGYFPIQFTYMEDLYIEKNVGLKSLVGCPIRIKKSFEFQTKGNYVTSLIGGPKEVGEVYKIVDFDGKIQTIEGICQHAHTMRIFSPFKTWHNVHKEIKEIERQIEITNSVKECLLGFLNIKGDFYIICGTDNSQSDDLERALRIINIHLTNGKDILDCQEELISKGLKDYAKF